MALYLIVVQAHFIMNNIFEGLIWFFLPASLVITNDIWAYICGITFGRTQLIKISPKKTVEGFVGAWIMTIFFGVILTNILTRSSYFICPVTVSLALFLATRRLLVAVAPATNSIFRISVPTFSPALGAPPTLSSFPRPTNFLNTSSSRRIPSSPSRSLPCSSIL